MTLDEALDGQRVSHDEAVYEVTQKHSIALDEFYAEFGEDEHGKGYDSAKILLWLGY